jgi:integrase
MASLRERHWKTPSGKLRSGWEVSWYEKPKNGQGKARQRKKVFSGKDAKVKARQLRGRLDAATVPARAEQLGADGEAAPPMTIASAAERWVKHVEKQGREKSTWKKYEQRFRDHIEPVLIARSQSREEARFGDIAVAELTAPDIEALKDKLVDRLSGDLAAKTLSVLRMMLNDVVRRGERESNPAQTVRIRNQARGEDEVQIPSVAEMRAIIVAAEVPPPAPLTFQEVWVKATIMSGLRPSENRGLAIEDLVLDGPDPGIPVRRRADQWNVIGPVKSASGRRFVSLPPSVVNLLKRWLLVVPRGDGFEDPERLGRKLHPVFPTSIGTLQSLANIYHRVWVPLMVRAGLADMVPVTAADGAPLFDGDGKRFMRPVPIYAINALRHFHASWLIDQDWSPKKVQKRMGHSSIQVTYDTYGHLFDKRDQDAAQVAKLEQKLLR